MNYTHFTTEFEAEVEEKPTQYSENIYDALYLMALAMTKAKANTKEAIVAEITNVSKDGTVVNAGEYAKAVELLNAGTDVNYEGAGGNVDFDAAGDVDAPFALWKVNSTGTGFE